MVEIWKRLEFSGHFPKEWVAVWFGIKFLLMNDSKLITWDGARKITQV